MQAQLLTVSGRPGRVRPLGGPVHGDGICEGEGLRVALPRGCPVPPLVLPAEEAPEQLHGRLPDVPPRGLHSFHGRPGAELEVVLPQVAEVAATEPLLVELALIVLGALRSTGRGERKKREEKREDLKFS